MVWYGSICFRHDGMNGENDRNRKNGNTLLRNKQQQTTRERAVHRECHNLGKLSMSELLFVLPKQKQKCACGDAVV